MTIPEINEQLGKYVADLMSTQKELENVLEDLPVAKHEEEKAYNAKLLEILAEAKTKGTREPTVDVKKAMAESATEMLSLSRRVIEFKREALKSRIDVIQVAISVSQTQARLLTEELQMSRYGKDGGY